MNATIKKAKPRKKRNAVRFPGITADATVWDFLTLYVWHWPQGWVLMSSEQDRLPGATPALVTDNYKFIRDKTPG